MHRTVFYVLSILFFLISVTDLQAPEITARDIFGFDIYHIAKDGSILNKDGAVRGWICENTVYDARWNVRH